MTTIAWNALAPNTRRTFEALAVLPVSSDFYLADGTALALQLGHRISYELDFFLRLIRSAWLNARRSLVGCKALRQP